MFAVGKTLKAHETRLKNASAAATPWRAPPLEFDGLTLGLLAYGRIARRVARIAKAVGMRVIAHDPFVFDADDVELVSYDELLSRNPTCCRCTHRWWRTPGISLMRTMFGRCKPGVIFINAARGGLVDHDALVQGARIRPGGLRRA